MFTIAQGVEGCESCITSKYTLEEFRIAWPDIARVFHESPGVQEIALKYRNRHGVQSLNVVFTRISEEAKI